MSAYNSRRLACDLIDVANLLRSAARCARPGASIGESVYFTRVQQKAKETIARAIERGNAAEDDRMESTLDIACLTLEGLDGLRSTSFFPEASSLLQFIADLNRYAAELEQRASEIEKQLQQSSERLPSNSTATSPEDEGDMPFDGFGKKTRLLLNYLWDHGAMPQRSIKTVMRKLGYKISSNTDKRSFRQLINRANNSLLTMETTSRYTIETQRKEAKIFLNDLAT